MTTTSRPPASRELVERMHAELLESRDVERVSDFFAHDFVSHNMPRRLRGGAEGVKEFFAEFHEGLDDLTVTIDVEVGEGDLVAVRTTTRGVHRGRFMGIPPTGRSLEIDGVDIVRIANGRIVEHWGLTNMAGLLRQVGPLASLRAAAYHLLRGRSARSYPAAA
jgi:steroid delta-isomerase-like uncharacterized protein